VQGDAPVELAELIADFVGTSPVAEGEAIR
jgi:hypothetical protein